MGVVGMVLTLYIKERSLTKVKEILNANGFKTKTNAEHSRVSGQNIPENVVYANADEDMYQYFKS